jgi:inorganic pyrophosphatase
MMVKVYIEVTPGSRSKNLYNEKTFELEGVREVREPYPYPYGFIIGTVTDDGEAVDAYIITDAVLEPGTPVECEPVGMLEMMEGDEVDHKVLCALPGEDVEIGEDLRQVLRTFIIEAFKAYPKVKVDVGNILPKQDALAHIHSAQEE